MVPRLAVSGASEGAARGTASLSDSARTHTTLTRHSHVREELESSGRAVVFSGFRQSYISVIGVADGTTQTATQKHFGEIRWFETGHKVMFVMFINDFARGRAANSTGVDKPERRTENNGNKNATQI